MHTINLKGKPYHVDASGLLSNFEEWDENFAEGMAPRLGIADGLTGRHWEVIQYIRYAFRKTGKCPLVFELCRGIGIDPVEFKKLFPSGYLRGACLLAGISYRDRVTDLTGRHRPLSEIPEEDKLRFTEKTYMVDQNGFLLDPSQWDEQFAVGKAEEMKMESGLTDSHWQIIHYLRKSYSTRNHIPTFFECCEENNLAFKDLEALFPDGYHRGAVKISGLRV